MVTLIFQEKCNQKWFGHTLVTFWLHQFSQCLSGFIGLV
nr:MAG TPA_asm: hypothetical protein [Caudoviricetes sp.]